jgi:molybdopterin molybdotransferase
MMAGLLPLDEAQRQLLALASDPQAEPIATEAALGRVLAKDLLAVRTQPAADLSAMDGYAICGEGPWTKIGESRAGEPFNGALQPGQCTRISTGAHMPQGSDRVLIQENAAIAGDVIAATDMPPPERHVRKRGFDFSKGDQILPAGTLIGPAQIALAMSSGNARVEVAVPPSIAVLDSGDELVADPSACDDHQIPASNGPMLAAMLRPLVGDRITRIGPVKDDRAALAESLAQVDAIEADILITSGGASVGDHDLIKPALQDWGAELSFWKVAMKPGKPLMVATRNGPHGPQVILGLPGNPVSSFVTSFLFALPLLRRALGMANLLPAPHQMIAGEALPEVGSRQEFLRGVHDGTTVSRASSQDSSALAALAQANCLIDRPAGSPAVAIGDPVPVYLLESG